MDKQKNLLFKRYYSNVMIIKCIFDLDAIERILIILCHIAFNHIDSFFLIL